MPDLRPLLSGLLRLARAARSAVFVVVFLVYLIFFMGLGQRLIVIPLTWLLPASGARILAPWVRLQAHISLWLFRIFAGVRVTVDGHIGPESCIVVMNHQSLFDIPLACDLIRGPYPLIPVRRRYQKVPVISHLIRLAGHPYVDPGQRKRPADRAAMTRAVEALGRGDNSFLIYAEGHRSREEGTIRPFETGGLRLAFAHAPEHPVYTILVEGFASIRTLADVSLRVAGTRARATVMGPFTIPRDPDQHNDFIASLRQRMVDHLAERAPEAGTTTADERSPAHP